jgi:hypothetical protein
VTSGDTPLFMRVVTACTACHRIGAGNAGCDGATWLLAGVRSPPVPGPQVSELFARESVDAIKG